MNTTLHAVINAEGHPIRSLMSLQVSRATMQAQLPLGGLPKAEWLLA